MGNIPEMNLTVMNVKGHEESIYDNIQPSKFRKLSW